MAMRLAGTMTLILALAGCTDSASRSAPSPGEPAVTAPMRLCATAESKAGPTGRAGFFYDLSQTSNIAVATGAEVILRPRALGRITSVIVLEGRSLCRLQGTFNLNAAAFIVTRPGTTRLQVLSAKGTKTVTVTAT